MTTARRIGAAAAALAAVVTTAGLGAAPAQAATTSCAVTWGSMAKTAGAPTGTAPSAYAATRTGHHACFDRVVVEVDGPAGGVNVGYLAATRTAPSNALLVQSGSRLGPKAITTTTASLPTVAKVVYFGRYSGTDAAVVTTRARLPFRVFTLAGPGGHSRIVVDVAHRW